MNYHRIQFEMKKDYGFQLGIVFILIRLTKRIYISQMMTKKTYNETKLNFYY
jgi:hypothetical protein